MHLLRITSRLLLFLCFSTHAVCANSPVASEKPNIVFFLVDDLGYGDLGYSGSQLAETPHLDAFAENNLIFSSAYASSPHCSPTRASIVTGQYPARLHITVWIGGNKATTYEGMELPRQKQFLEADIPTVAEYLKGQGYVTAQIGKWHIGGLVVPITEHGFDEVIGYAPGAGPGAKDRWYAPYQSIRDFDGPEGEYITDRLTDEAIEFIKGQEGAPFFMLLQHYDVHAPLTAPDELVQKYVDRGRPLEKQNENATFLAMKEKVDDSFGRIMEALDEAGISDNTIVIFFSDNGGVSYFANNGPLRAGKKFLYEGGIRVPMIMRVPGMTPSGETTDIPVNAVDFFPTLVELTGGDPAEVDAPLDGVSLVPVLKGEDLEREALYWHMPQLGRDWRVIPPQGAVRKGPWKLVHHYGETRPDELYNLEKDIGEEQNLAGKHPEIVAKMRALLEAHLAEVDAQRVVLPE
jgi:arylsulfatase A